MPELSRNYRLLEARYVSRYLVWVLFSDGVEGEIDLGPELEGPVFEPLKDPKLFRQFSVHPELHTLVWPNGADFAPEFHVDSDSNAPPKPLSCVPLALLEVKGTKA